MTFSRFGTVPLKSLVVTAEEVSMTTTDKTVASTILSQLGGRMFLMMTGAKNLLATDNSLTGKIGRNAKGVTHFTVTLESDDTYTVRFVRCYGTKMTEKGTTSGVYCDMLRELFESSTGLYLSL